ncbi:unnamed protein product [Didymodactylos carnosus]|uniref:Uncharacterized protein n=1 Tax=Didymodactylos carnosus TaxID=1234261 RepID=A0A8S2HWD1_9BILA|nr:unnamed protein product [Didymodactylos carnosus]CAF3691001.1 unnamed protein product [Didymodactylos carnosus]
MLLIKSNGNVDQIESKITAFLNRLADFFEEGRINRSRHDGLLGRQPITNEEQHELEFWQHRAIIYRMVQTYVDISLYGITIWNVHDAIINDLPRTNNHVEGYNSHLEKSDMQIRKRKKLYNNIDSKLKELHEEHKKGTNAEPAIKCGRAF